MKKLLILSSWLFWVLLAVTVASCHSDDPAPLDAKLIEGTFVPSPGKFLVNGEDYSDKGISLQFEPSKTKEGKYDLKIYGIIPYPKEYVQVDVAVSPTADGIAFADTDAEDASVHIKGVFSPNHDGAGYRLEADCSFTQIFKNWTNKTFVINFTKPFFDPDRLFTDECTIDGETYLMDDLIRNFYSQMGGIIAKQDSCVQLKFNSDYTLDISSLNNKDGKTVSDSLMTIKCWCLSLHAILEFTGEQAKTFMKRWVGTYGHGEENNLFLQYANTDRYALFVWMYQKESSGKKFLVFNFPKTTRSRFLYLFMQNREVSLLPEIEQKKLKTAFWYMYNPDEYGDMPPYIHSEY